MSSALVNAFCESAEEFARDGKAFARGIAPTGADH
jgi:hypothetical protein